MTKKVLDSKEMRFYMGKMGKDNVYIHCPSLSLKKERFHV